MGGIAFLIALEESPHAGVVRPLVNWARTIKKDREVECLLLKAGPRIAEKLEELDIPYRIFSKLPQLSRHLATERHEWLVVDDYWPRLSLLDRIEGVRLRKAVYVQLLYAIHAIAEAFARPPAMRVWFSYKIARLIPFTLLKRRYVNTLRKTDLLVANSHNAAMLLKMLYGVEVDGVVYPPVDDAIFSPKAVKKRDRALVYAGSNAGDTEPELVTLVCDLLERRDVETLLIGGSRVVDGVEGFRIVEGVNDEELAALYASSRLTVCPQMWEQFGYVAAESIMCGTPILAFNYLGPREIVEMTGYGLLAYNRREFIRLLENIDEHIEALNPPPPDPPFSIDRSSRGLLTLIDAAEKGER
jgi:glycosyltransferase involved in cell wall biosynthesis